MKLRKEILLVFILLFFTIGLFTLLSIKNDASVIASGSESAFSEDLSVSENQIFSEDLTWKAVIVSGYASENGNVLLNWDRSRRKFHQEILRRGISPKDVRILTSLQYEVGRTVSGAIIRPATINNFFQSIYSLGLKEGDGLIIFMTSHGSKKKGFVFEIANNYQDHYLSIEQFYSGLKKNGLEKIPTAIFISACYSGQYIDGVYGAPETNEYRLTRRNRIIMTAASNKTSSFG
jgi:hypothetical protein